MNIRVCLIKFFLIKSWLERIRPPAEFAINPLNLARLFDVKKMIENKSPKTLNQLKTFLHGYLRATYFA